MALHGDNAVIGAVADDVGANVNQGSAYVFTREAGVWSEQEKLTQSDGDSGDEFGLSTPLDEDTAIVGAYRDNIGSNVDQGSAYVFVGFGAVPTALTLDPAAASNPVDTEHCVTASVADAFGNAVSDVTVEFAVAGAVNTAAAATTDTNGQAEFCYAGPAFPGADSITAYADTDADDVQDAGEPDGTAEKTWTLPESTDRCAMTGGGSIVTAAGHRANFGGNANAPRLRGQLQYHDHGAAAMKVHSITVQAVACDSSTQAQIHGQAAVAGSGVVRLPH